MLESDDCVQFSNVAPFEVQAAIQMTAPSDRRTTAHGGDPVHHRHPPRWNLNRIDVPD